MTHRHSTVLVLVLCAVGCGSEATTAPADILGTDSAGAPADASDSSSSTPEASGGGEPEDTLVEADVDLGPIEHDAGLATCPESFLVDGECVPSAAACGDRELPSLLSGCVPVGVVDCAPAFVRDGGCRPRRGDCSGDERPDPVLGCLPVGPAVCADIFRDATGACRVDAPSCPPGTIVDVRAGCVPVGPATCAPEFVREGDGACVPDATHCPDNHLLVPSLGCVAVGGPDGCGEGTFGNIPDLPNTVYVDPKTDVVDGDGSRDAPLKTLVGASELFGPGSQSRWPRACTSPRCSSPPA